MISERYCHVLEGRQLVLQGHDSLSNVLGMFDFEAEYWEEDRNDEEGRFEASSEEEEEEE